MIFLKVFRLCRIDENTLTFQGNFSVYLRIINPNNFGINGVLSIIQIYRIMALAKMLALIAGEAMKGTRETTR